MYATRGVWMSVYDRVEQALPTPFGEGDVLDIFETLQVYVEFTSDRPGRRPVLVTIKGHPGEWVCAYSSLDRLLSEQGDGIEYSCMLGRTLIQCLRDDVGVWFDRRFSSGRKILLPSVEW